MYNAEIYDCVGSEDCAVAPPSNRRRCRRMEAAETKYPPPMPWLACTENRHSQMPWVMKRYYSGDGRLVIKEERVRNHEYLQVQRSNGRLVLNLVPLNDVVEEDHGEMEKSEVIGNNGGDEGSSDQTVGELVPRCYTYSNNDNSLGVNTCGGFRAVVPAAFSPPVHT